MNITIMMSIIAVCLGVLIAWIVSKYLRKNSETKISTEMITSGIALVVGAFPGTKEVILGLVAKYLEIGENVGTDYAMIACGVILILFGIYYDLNIRDKIYVLNMFGIPVQKEISDEKNIKDLKLADYKVKESIIDIVGIYDNEMDEKKNEIIVGKIKKSAEAFANRSKGFKSGFTGMAPIPYTIYAGLFLANGDTRRYFEYHRQNSRYCELRKRKKLREAIPDIKIQDSEHPDEDASEVVMALSVTRTVQDSDLVQFAQKDVIRIDTDETKDNLITTLAQLDKYAKFINDELEQLKNTYPKLRKVHLVAAIPSCLSLEIGKLFALNSHRLPQVISYHYVSSEQIKYPFGVIVSDGLETNRGKLVKG